MKLTLKRRNGLITLRLRTQQGVWRAVFTAPQLIAFLNQHPIPGVAGLNALLWKLEEAVREMRIGHYEQRADGGFRLELRLAKPTTTVEFLLDPAP